MTASKALNCCLCQETIIDNLCSVVKKNDNFLSSTSEIFCFNCIENVYGKFEHPTMGGSFVQGCSKCSYNITHSFCFVKKLYDPESGLLEKEHKKTYYFCKYCNHDFI